MCARKGSEMHRHWGLNPVQHYEHYLRLQDLIIPINLFCHTPCSGTQVYLNIVFPSLPTIITDRGSDDSLQEMQRNQ